MCCIILPNNSLVPEWIKWQIKIWMVNHIVLANCHFQLRKLYLQNFYSKRKGWYWKSLIWMFLKLWHCQIISYLFASFKTIILCSVHSVWFMKYVFSAKIWFVKTSTRIVKCESRVVKSDPEYAVFWLHPPPRTLQHLHNIFQSMFMYVLFPWGTIFVWPYQVGWYH